MTSADTQLQPQRVLVAVEDTPAGFRAVDVAIALAVTTGAELRFVHVTSDGTFRRTLAPGVSEAQLVDRLERGTTALLDHVEARARRAGVPSTGAALDGDPAAQLLTEARAWAADLLVIGRGDSGRRGQPYVGHVTRHVLEFADVPVLVVPPRRAGVG
jgi:nucleotide-binding universal stress UspA family protein